MPGTEFPANDMPAVRRELDSMWKIIGDLQTRTSLRESSITEGGLRWVRLSDLKTRLAITHALGTPPDEPVVFVLRDPTDPDIVRAFIGDAGPAGSGNVVSGFKDRLDQNILVIGESSLPGNDHGDFTVFDHNNVRIVHMDGAGLQGPEWNSAWVRIDVGDRVRTSNAGYTVAWRCGMRGLFHDLLRCTIAVDTAGGATGEVKVRDEVSGNATNAKVIGAGFNGSIELQWQHGIPLDSPNRSIVIEQRVTNATGSIGCRPDSNLCHVSKERLAPAAGGWV